MSSAEVRTAGEVPALGDAVRDRRFLACREERHRRCEGTYDVRGLGRADCSCPRHRPMRVGYGLILALWVAFVPALFVSEALAAWVSGLGFLLGVALWSSEEGRN